jgi:hypothetical protein
VRIVDGRSLAGEPSSIAAGPQHNFLHQLVLKNQKNVKRILGDRSAAIGCCGASEWRGRFAQAGS